MKDQAIRELYPHAVEIIEERDAYDIDGNLITLDLNAVEVKYQQLLSEYNLKQYARDRQVAYKSITEQLDMQYWDRVNGTDTWKQHIDAVKTAHPKPTE